MKNEFEIYLESRFRLNTKRGITNVIKLYQNWCEKENIQIETTNYNEILAYMNYCREKGNSKRTIYSKLNCIKHYYDFLITNETSIKTNPAGEIRIKNIQRLGIKNNVKYEDIEKLYQNYPTGGLIQKRNKCILGLLIYQGLSIGEIDKLEVKDVKLNEGKIYIPAMARSNSRILNLESHQIMQLQNYILFLRPMLQAQAEDNSEYLFIAGNKSNRKKSRGNTFTGIQRIFTNLRKIAPEIKEVKDIRSTVINHWLKQYNIRQVQYMIGHKYISSTERYSTNKLETLQEQIELLHPMK